MQEIISHGNRKFNVDSEMMLRISKLIALFSVGWLRSMTLSSSPYSHNKKSLDEGMQ